MKKRFLSLLLAMLMVLSTITILPITGSATPVSVPTVTDVNSAGYGGSEKYVLVVYFDEQITNDVVWTGTYNAWSTNVDDMIKFKTLEGFSDWYVAEFEDGSSPCQGKIVQLMNDGSFNTYYQSGDEEAWSNMAQPGTKTMSFDTSTPGETRCVLPEKGVYIYELEQFTYPVIDGTAKDANGSITVAKTARKNATVTITVKPDEGYQLKTLKYNDGTTDYDITKDATSGNYQFTMPAKAVTVTAEFEAAAGTTKIYFETTTDCDWSVDGAKIGVVSFDGADYTTSTNKTGAFMTLESGRIYSAEITLYDNIQFYRYDPSATEIAYANIWNGTAVMAKPTDGSTKFTAQSWGEDDQFATSGTWSVYPIVHDLTVTTWSALQEAINAAPGNLTNPAAETTNIKLAGDLTAPAEGSSYIDIPAGKNIILDLNGHTLDRGLSEKEAITEGNVIRAGKDVSLTVKNGTITGSNGTPDFNKGALRCQETKELNLIDVDFANCKNVALYLYGVKSTNIDGCTFSDNTYGGGEVGGAAIDAGSSGTDSQRKEITIKDCLFKNNTLTGGSGSAIHLYVKNYGYDTTIINSTFTGNHAGSVLSADDGGAICIYNGSLVLDGCTITGNTAAAESLNNHCGGVSVAGKTASVTLKGKTVIAGNTCGGNAADLYFANKETTVKLDGLAEGSKIGVLTAYDIEEGSSAVVATNAASAYAEYFFSDSTEYYVDFNTDHLELKAVGTAQAVSISAVSGGVVYTDKQVVEAGAAGDARIVTLTVIPDEGYQLKSLKYNDGSDHDITKDQTSGNYQFTMPAANVTVTATFEETATKTPVSAIEVTIGNVTRDDLAALPIGFLPIVSITEGNEDIVCHVTNYFLFDKDEKLLAMYSGQYGGKWLDAEGKPLPAAPDFDNVVYVVAQATCYRDLSVDDDDFASTVSVKVNGKEFGVVENPNSCVEGYFSYGGGLVIDVKYDLSAHTHTGVKQDGQPATETAAGFKDYYECDCGLYFEDENCTTEIGDDTALAAWKAEDGNGYLAKLPHSHNFVKQNAVEAGKDTAGCKEYYICSCGEAYEDEALTKKITDLNSWKAEGGAGYIAPNDKGGANLTWLWILLGILGLLIVLYVVLFFVWKKKEELPNAFAFLGFLVPSYKAINNTLFKKKDDKE